MNKMSRCGLLAAFMMMMVFLPADAAEVIIADSIMASSTLTGGDYDADNLQDYNANTAWVEGAAGNGIGESLIFSISAGTQIDGITIFPGYQKSEDLLFKNSAPTMLRISDGDIYQEICFDDAANTYYGNEGSGYDCYFDVPLTSSGYIEVEIMDIRAGWKYEDTCISELRFLGSRSEYQPEYEYGDDTGYYDESSQGFPGDSGDYNSYADVQTGSDGAELPDDIQRCRLSDYAYNVCRIHRNYNVYAPDDIKGADLTKEEQAYILYWYQYMVSDPRINSTLNVEYNFAYLDSLVEIIYELFGENLKNGAINYFMDNYVEMTEGELIYMNGTGDFGDAGDSYFEEADTVWEENGKTVVSGRIMQWNSNMQCYIHTGQYTAYFTPNPAEDYEPQTWCFEEVVLN